MTDKDRMSALRAKRLAIAEKRESMQKRSEYSERVISVVNRTLGVRFSLNDFDIGFMPDAEIVWGEGVRQIETCPGLNTGCVTMLKAISVANCIQKKMNEVVGHIGFDEYKFMGCLHFNKLMLKNMVELSNKLNDSVFLYGANFTILFDCYKKNFPGEKKDYAIVAQGQDVEKKLQDCFGE